MAKILFLCLFSGLLILGPGCGDSGSKKNPASSPELADPAGTVAFADSHLDSAIHRALQKPGVPLTRENLLSLTKLEAREAGIAELDGIEQLENLTVLDLAGNRIRDIAPLGSLTRLTFLDLSRNRIENIAPLTALSDLEILVLAGNPLQDVAPLLELKKLTSLELTGCPLNDESRQVYLPALGDKGVEVTFLLDTGEGDVDPFAIFDFEIIFIGDSNNLRTDIFHMKTNGSEPINLTDNPVHQYHSLTCSPDGQRIAYVEGGEMQSFNIYAMDLEDGDVVRLTEQSGTQDTYRRLTWSPDGQRIVLVKSYSLSSQNLNYSEIGIVRTDGSGYADLTQTVQDGLFHDDPVWSPDGERIAFVRYRYSYDGESFEWQWLERGIHVIGVDGSRPVRLAEWGFDPSWSPDGSQIVFVRSSEDMGISRVDAEGGNPVELTQYFDLAPVWSPDDERIAFVRNELNNSADVYMVSADGGLPFNLTQNPSWDGEHAWSWSPDGKWIGFLREGNVWAVPAAGGEAINLTNHIQKSIHAFRWVP